MVSFVGEELCGASVPDPAGGGANSTGAEPGRVAEALQVQW